MTYPRLSILCFLMAVIIGVLFIRINSLFGGCLETSQHTYKVGTGFGYKMRLVYGTLEGQAHQWAEYWNEDRRKWCLWDNEKLGVGKSWYTAEESGYITIFANDRGWV